MLNRSRNIFSLAFENEQLQDSEESWEQLKPSEVERCRLKFEKYKDPILNKITHNGLNRMLIDNGIHVTPEQISKMIYEAEPNGCGYLSEKKMLKIIELNKRKIQNEKIQQLEFTFHSILGEQQRDSHYRQLESDSEYLSIEFLKRYLSLNFEVGISSGLLKTLKGRKRGVSKEEFIRLFC